MVGRRVGRLAGGSVGVGSVGRAVGVSVGRRVGRRIGHTDKPGTAEQQPISITLHGDTGSPVKTSRYAGGNRDDIINNTMHCMCLFVSDSTNRTVAGKCPLRRWSPRLPTRGGPDARSFARSEYGGIDSAQATDKRLRGGRSGGRGSRGQDSHHLRRGG